MKRPFACDNELFLALAMPFLSFKMNSFMRLSFSTLFLMISTLLSVEPSSVMSSSKLGYDWPITESMLSAMKRSEL